MTQSKDTEKKNDEMNFDLPDVSDIGGKAAPRIHKGPEDSTCTSCEG